MQTPIKTLFMRGGTSRGPFFNEADLPADLPTRDRVLLAVLGSPDKRQIDGLGGAHPLTSKAGIVRPSTTPNSFSYSALKLPSKCDFVTRFLRSSDIVNPPSMLICEYIRSRA